MGMSTLPDNWIGLLGVIVTTVGTIVMSLITYSKKKDSDKEDKAAAPVIEEAERHTNLQAVVDTLAWQLAEAHARLDRDYHLRHVKYPVSLETIRNLFRENPDSRVEVPGPIEGDL